MTATNPVPYQTQLPNDRRWTQDVYQRLIHGEMSAAVTVKEQIKTATVSGPCPYCDDDVGFSEDLTAVTGESPGYRAEFAIMFPGGAQQQPEFVTFTASCLCNGQHAGRPADVHRGCGINFQVKVRPS
jgi:hypothetical protein